MQARLIAIEGIDQAGKKTQTRVLSRHLLSQGFNVITLSFPVYRSSSGRSIRGYLEGKRLYPFHALCMLYSLNRWEHSELLRRSLAQYDFLIANRYTPSGLAYGMAGGLRKQWLESLDRGLPEPDEVLVLDIPVKGSIARKRERRDIHERNVGYLENVRRAYLRLSRQLDWKVVPAGASIDKVQQRIRGKLRL